ncbi:hypothetical protein SRB5_63770 [Streptomyces sp. RB5]|uniref:Uncharacterized protein n=1 Tax=Streptomyces smaragdinus TaxID=2585196 RepID=A0A7K0CRW5_9ACTN|nr:hypothetical protein [Streptomyces smaragdinus]MQY16181.1 hypothetical protein [Streptomyces smaragdinus]
MSFEAEWAQHKANATAQMQLNQVAPEPGGGGGNLQTDYEGKKRAAEYVDTTLLPNTQAAGRIASGGGGAQPPIYGPPSSSSPGSQATKLRAWAVHAGLDEALVNWGKSVQTLGQRLANESAALKGTRTIFQNGDGLTGNQFNGLTTPGLPGLQQPNGFTTPGLQGAGN